MQFIQSQGWNWQEGTDGHIQIETCPFCKKGDYKLYMNTQGNKDGCWMCFHGSCGKNGNLRSLQDELGITIRGVDSRSAWSAKERKIDALPDVEACHRTLLGDADALDYLLNSRGFTEEVVKRQKIGLVAKHYIPDVGEVRALMIPYLVNGNIVFCKYRSLPPSPKGFNCPVGHDAPLYNGEILKEGLQEVVFVEGETNTLCMMSHGIENAVGVPGANFKKASWIEILDRIAPKRLYVMYDNDEAGRKASQTLASRIGYDKCLRLVLPEFYVNVPLDECKRCDDDGNRKITHQVRTGINSEIRSEYEEVIVCDHRRLGKDINEWFTKGGGTLEAFEEMKQHAQLFDVTGVVNTGGALDELEAMLEGKETLAPTYRPPWAKMAEQVGWENGDVIDIIAPEKIGKAGRLSSLVKTVTGWARNGDLRVGDVLASVDGKPSVVTGVFPQGVLEMFKVTFSDGRSTEVSAEHLWKVCHVDNPEQWRVYTTDAIVAEYGRNQVGHGQHTGNLNKKLYVPLVSGDFGNEDDLPLDPWLMGVLIGDGGLTNGTPIVTNVDAELLQRLSDICSKHGLSLMRTESDSTSYRLSAPRSGGTQENPITRALREVGLWHHRAEDKFIPLQYLNASKDDRWELLRGLMDTDGTAGNRYGTTSYTSVSERLALDVQHLVRSLGGLSRVGLPTKKSFRYKGELRTGQPAYLVSVLMPEREKLFTIPRKLSRVKPRSYQPRLTFTHVESIGFHEAQCITVSHPSRLYITDDYIVTHNTTFGLNIMEAMVDKYDEDGLIVCLEMSQVKLARKWVCMVTSTDDSPPKNIEEEKLACARMKAAIPVARAKAAARKSDLHFCYPQIKTPDDVYKLIIDCIRRYGVKWVMFDNLQYLCDSTLGKNYNHRTIVLSQISKSLAKIAKDYGIKMIRIVQPKRIGKFDTVTTDDVDGSSQVEKDCDCAITLHRKRLGNVTIADWDMSGVIETESSFESRMLVTIGLSRYSCGGSCTLEFLGNMSQVVEYNAARKASLLSQAPTLNGELPQEQINLPSTGPAQVGEITF